MAAQAASLLEQRIDELFRTSPAVEAGTAGVEVVQLGAGKVLYSRNAGKLLTPASNTKLFSSALALTKLGPDFKIPTRVFAGRAPDSAGRVEGDLTIVGYGDPSMSFLEIPYAKDGDQQNPMAAIEAFADQVVAHGVHSISGDVIGDDAAFPDDLFPPGWAQDDATWEYGAPVSALSLGSNSMRAAIVPGAQAGDPANIELSPALEYFTIDNQVRTVAAGDHRVDVRRPGRGELQVSGTVSIQAGPAVLWLAVDDPALYTATALYDALTRRGVAIGGHPSARHRHIGTPAGAPGELLLAERLSPPLSELLRVTDKISQNLWAELMLRQVAFMRTGDGSRQAGLDQLKAFLVEIGVADGDYVFEDGSGLSRLTLVKPEAIVRLLTFMHASPLRDIWVGLMPVGGQDGTLANRFSKDPAAKNIHAKTGSLSHVNALSGYAESATYGEVVFSIIVNDTVAPSSEIRAFIDKIGMTLLE
jgi:D-alanyl-D-alanine carboxypeptidase/D-alanyl-D-alanine-endopeptidase (penicillin-binding protein 4)